MTFDSNISELINYFINASATQALLKPMYYNESFCFKPTTYCFWYKKFAELLNFKIEYYKSFDIRTVHA